MGHGFKFGKKAIGGDAPVFLIAELSANHGGSLDVALRTIEAAAKAGADAIKLQTYTPDTLTLKSSAAPFIVKTKNAWANRTLHDLYREAMTPWEWHAELKGAAESFGLEIFSTPFDPTALAFLEALGVPGHKIASFEIVDLTLVEAVAARGKPVIMSTGMASLGEIEAAVRVCREAGNRDLALLRCVSAYPAHPESMHLKSLETLRAFGAVIGLSDHTREHTSAVAAVALGAKLIEKHFILDRSAGGPDSFFSLEPNEFAGLVKEVRAAESALGPPRFGASPEERASLAFRRSLFVAEDVRAGDVLTCDRIRSVRPADGLPVKHMPEILGRVAACDVPAGTPLSWSMVGSAAPKRAEVALRPATTDDAPALLAWRNDPATRAMSVVQTPVTEAEHAAWLAKTLASPDRKLFIGLRGSQSIGQIRLDRVSPNAWEISITVAPEARGDALASALLLAAESTCAPLGPDCQRFVARIRKDNERSVRAFKRAGYYGFSDEKTEQGAFVRCERRIAPYEAS